ncbi:hypothetical protein GCM10023189_40130 [Nibrella saemangeumensis]|uniref:Cupin type-2 domain-containing protein n=2 Tax=Nibrella saemangeumensis TaxID=1084526 RepID=A0ABP8N804_9BACT
MIALATALAFSQASAPSVFSWKQAPVVKRPNYEERTLMQGTTSHFSDIRIQAITHYTKTSPEETQQLDEEALVIIREGELTLTLGGKQKTLGPGSVVVLMPGDAFRLDNQTDQPLTYYFIRYTSNEMPDLDLYRLTGDSFWVDSRDVPYTPDDKGGIRRLFAAATVMNRRCEMNIMTLNPGIWRNPPHTHQAAELLIILENTALVHSDGEQKRAEAGDVIFWDAGVAHAIQNTMPEKCSYIALHFQP